MTQAQDNRALERTLIISKLMLLEVGPLLPFLHGRDSLDVLEVGGNIGMWCEAFHEGFGHRIASYRAYEPMPANIEVFRRRLRDHLPDAEVEIVPAAVGDTTGTVTIHFDQDVTSLASIPLAQVENRNGEVVVSHTQQREVEQIRLDDQITGHVDVVKIDTEGYERNVIDGMTASIDAGLVDNVYFEYGIHQVNLGQPFKEFYEFFKDRGWSLYAQGRARNYFGLNLMPTYKPFLEERLGSRMRMVLASRTGPSPDYAGPRVTGLMRTGGGGRGGDDD